MTTTSTLSFELKSSLKQDESGFSYLLLDIIPFCNQKPFYKPGRSPDVFDFTRVVLQDQSGEVDIFTCTCGVAGCVGIMDECLIEISEQEVSWTFPEEPFKAELNSDLFEGSQGLKLTFNRQEYLAAITALVAEIEALCDSQAMPVIVTFEEYEVSHCSQSYLVRLANARQYREKQAQWQQARADAEGDIAKWGIRAILDTHLVMTGTLSDIVWDRLYEECPTEDAMLQQLNGGFREAVLQNPLRIAHQIPKERIALLFSLEKAPSTVESLPDNWVELNWPRATLELFEL